jgi:cytochrome P450
LLARQPDLAARAVEETMRHSPIVFGTLRTVVEDVEVAGYLIPAGTLVILNSAAANRDSGVCDEPDRLDITRTTALPMHTFGGGLHYCLGANLARLELTEALTVMARRMPNIRRAGPAPWKPLTGLSGPATLPVEFDPGY